MSPNLRAHIRLKIELRRISYMKQSICMATYDLGGYRDSLDSPSHIPFCVVLVSRSLLDEYRSIAISKDLIDMFYFILYVKGVRVISKFQKLISIEACAFNSDDTRDPFDLLVVLSSILITYFR